MGKTVSILLTVLTVSIYFIGCGKSVEERIAEQLELGNRYLEEMNYEQAIVAFTKVIEIDARQVQAYIGGAEAYAAMASYEDAASLLESGTENIQAAALVEKMGEVCQSAAQYYIETEDYEKAEEFVNRGLAVESFEALEKLDQEVKSIPLLEEMKELLASEDYNAVEELANNQQYIDMADSLGESELYYYGEYNEAGERNGEGIAVYNGPIFYYGSWLNGKRSGYGVAVEILADNPKCRYGVYKGEWENDLPNGQGEEYYEIMAGALEENTGRDSKRSGNYVNGLYDGKVYVEITWSNGSVKSYYGTAQNGVWQYVEEPMNGTGPIFVAENGDHDLNMKVEDNKNQGIRWLLSD